MGLFGVERLREIEKVATHESIRPLVMVVDDEDVNRRRVSKVLCHSFRVLEAKNGEEAWDLICSMENPSELACIISDLHMPKMTGLDLLRQVRDSYPKIVRIIITAHGDVDAVIEAINELDIYKFIIKPYQDSDFLLTVRRAVQSFEMQCELDKYHTKLEEMVHTRTRQLVEIATELERIMQLLRQNRAHLVVQAGEVEGWRSCFCAILNDAADVAYAEHGFEQLMRKQWKEATLSCLPPQLIDFLKGDSNKFTTASLVACKQRIENSWFLWLRKALPIDGLTLRELDVTGLLAAGLTHKEIAKRLKIAPATVRSHLQRLHDKLDVKTNAELVVKCLS
jgi:DNA-binding NarL/FixJ family response regulator